MWTIVLPLIGGYIFAFKKPGAVSKIPVDFLINVSLVLLLTVMGGRIGADPEVIGQLGTLGIQAFVVALMTILGSVAVLSILQFCLIGHTKGENSYLRDSGDPNNSDDPGDLNKDVEAPTEAKGNPASKSEYHLTAMLLLSVLAGIILGIFVLPEAVLPTLTSLTTWILGLLLLGVGLDLGGSTQIFANLRALGPRVVLLIVLLPVGVAVGSIAFAIIPVFFWNFISWSEAAALASGFGWYSLSAVIISEIHSPLLGAMAFLVNVFRELVALVIIPIVARRIGPIPSIGTGGATAMDVTLPVISKSAGREFVPLAFFTGVTLSLMVPVLVNLFIWFS